MFLKILIDCIFASVLGVLCGAMGFHFAKEPCLYLSINVPAIGLFSLLTSMLRHQKSMSV